MAARLARASGRVHPKEWVEIYESHTPYEWLMQRTLAAVDPWGDDRDDLRAALNTLANYPGTGDKQELLQALLGYIEINKAAEHVGPADMRRALES